MLLRLVFASRLILPGLKASTSLTPTCGIAYKRAAMIAEANKFYRGVICMHCHQPTPLTAAADKKAKQATDEFEILSIPLRCMLCHREGVYAPKDVRKFEGNPPKR